MLGGRSFELRVQIPSKIQPSMERLVLAKSVDVSKHSHVWQGFLVLELYLLVLTLCHEVNSRTL